MSASTASATPAGTTGTALATTASAETAAHTSGMTADSAREAARHSNGQFGLQERPLPNLLLERPDPNALPMCGNCGGTVRDGYCSDCGRRGDWVSDTCDDCGRDLEEEEAASAFCDACAENVGDDALTHRERAEYAAEWAAGPGRKALTDQERAHLEAALSRPR
ncbi:hypothetical protein [Curtobacterium sp. MCBD17_040]|uniref:hypothetical protein n=1 Tax=Curtobacterium sp. MCBD17_040 TaxID=2175674 RepID=UPI0024DF4ACF|nr:hypothetical protein [Curtobacterium sp. MCBD17_040]WIB65372.1 hypothetical protein DEI94_18365 [Curtobacterium sp. MCBD17_040]